MARPIRPLSPSGSPLLIFLQVAAGVGGAVDARLRSAVDQRPDVPPSLIGRGVEHVGIARIEHDVGHPGVLADRRGGLPGLAAVGGLVQSAVAARASRAVLARPRRRHSSSAGRSAILAMCSEFSSPTFVKLAPPSIDLYRPSP